MWYFFRYRFHLSSLLERKKYTRGSRRLFQVDESCSRKNEKCHRWQIHPPWNWWLCLTSDCRRRFRTSRLPQHSWCSHWQNKNLYQIGTKDGTVKGWHTRTSIGIEQKFMEPEQVPTTKLLTVREASSKQSLTGGQGFKKCTCRSGENKCETARCSCFKNNCMQFSLSPEYGMQ